MEGIFAWLLSLDTRAREINDRLEQDPEIAAYPFPFRVLEISNGIAAVASPRSAEVSVMRFLGLVDPDLREADPDSPAAIAAQKTLGEIQGRVRKLIEAETDIEGVRWRVDTDWFAARGVRLQY